MSDQVFCIGESQIVNPYGAICVSLQLGPPNYGNTHRLTSSEWTAFKLTEVPQAANIATNYYLSKLPAKITSSASSHEHFNYLGCTVASNSVSCKGWLPNENPTTADDGASEGYPRFSSGSQVIFLQTDVTTSDLALRWRSKQVALSGASQILALSTTLYLCLNLSFTH